MELNDKTSEHMKNVMKDVSVIISDYVYKDPAATASALLVLSRNFYLTVYGTDVAAEMFYRIADDLAVMANPKNLM